METIFIYKLTLTRSYHIYDPYDMNKGFLDRRRKRNVIIQVNMKPLSLTIFRFSSTSHHVYPSSSMVQWIGASRDETLLDAVTRVDLGSSWLRLHLHVRWAAVAVAVVVAVAVALFLEWGEVKFAGENLSADGRLARDWWWWVVAYASGLDIVVFMKK